MDLKSDLESLALVWCWRSDRKFTICWNAVYLWS